MRVRPNLVSMRSAIFLVALSLASATAARGQVSPVKPLLSGEIRRILDRDGAAAAQRRFDEMYPAHKDRYELDVGGLDTLVLEYLRAGDQSTAELIMKMSATITRDRIADMAASMSVPTHTPESDTLERAGPEPRAVAPVPDLGPARDDLSRFSGLYGTAAPQGRRRDLFVTVSCDGHLVVGAMWADTDNWWMRSISDHAFESSRSPVPLHLEFEIGPDGAVRAMRHDLGDLPTPLPRSGPLPDGWGECVPREGG